MAIDADEKRKRMPEPFVLRCFPLRTARDTVHADCLREIQEDVVITSPKVYESGIITSLALRLVDLYGDCVIERDPALVERELVS